jgi:hypothetical protein
MRSVSVRIGLELQEVGRPFGLASALLARRGSNRRVFDPLTYRTALVPAGAQAQDTLPSWDAYRVGDPAPPWFRSPMEEARALGAR